MEFLLDPYEGKTVEELKENCRRLARGYMRQEMTILLLAASAPAAVESLPRHYKDRVVRLVEAYSDPE
jgi:hypothetical protein